MKSKKLKLKLKALNILDQKEVNQVKGGTWQWMCIMFDDHGSGGIFCVGTFGGSIGPQEDLEDDLYGPSCGSGCEYCC